jgi:hypothetical protein
MRNVTRRERERERENKNKEQKVSVADAQRAEEYYQQITDMIQNSD